MNKNKLYTVNKWNRHIFQNKNFFDRGGGLQTDFYNFKGLGFPDTSTKLPKVQMNFDASKLKPIGTSSDNQSSSGDSGGSGMPSKFGFLAAIPETSFKVGGTNYKRGIWDIADPLYQLAGNKESAVGNAFSDAGVSMFKASAQSGNAWGMLAGGITKGVGSLINAAWGIGEDTDMKLGAEKGIEYNNRYTSNASTFDEIQGPEAVVDNNDVYTGGWFSKGKARRKNEDLRRQINEAKHHALSGLENNIENIAKNQMSTGLRNWYAFGGPLNDYGLNSGALGLMMQRNYLDSIDKRSEALSRNNLNLITTNSPLLAFGGELGTNGTDWTNGLLYVDAGGSHESNPLEGVPMGVDAEGIPNLVEEGETVFNNYVFSNRMKVPKELQKELGLGGALKKGITFAEASKKIAKESERRPNDPISMAGLEDGLNRLAAIQEAERMKQQMKEYVGLGEYACGGKMGRKYALGDYLYNWDEQPTTYYEELQNTPAPWLDYGSGVIMPEVVIRPQSSTSSSVVSASSVSDSSEKSRSRKSRTSPSSSPELVEEEVKTYPTWMRYVPAFGAGIMTLTDALGLTNKPDYEYANKIEAAANRAGLTPNITYNPIGNYLRYNPMDIWYEQNRLNANTRATDRAIMNNGTPTGTKNAALLANSYANQIASGNLYRQALEYNDAKRRDVEDFNRKTNMFNSQMGLEAAMANARYAQAARSAELSGLAQAASLREAIDQRLGAARSANISNLLTSLGNIGRENFALNQLNTDRSRNYTTSASGKSGYKRKEKEAEESKNKKK